MSSNQPHKTDQSQGTPATAGATESAPTSNLAQGIDQTHVENDLIQRNSLTVTELASFGASNNSTPAIQKNAARTLRTELAADTVLIIDYIDAFGGKAVRASSGADAAINDSEIWLPEALSAVDPNSPITLIDVDPNRFTAITAMATDSEFRSAIAIAIPGITGAAGMLIALSTQPVEYNETQIETAQTIASVLSLSASRSKALNAAHKGESQLAASRHITRSSAIDSRNPKEGGVPKTLLGKIADQLKQFFEFDVITLRVQVNGEFNTRESHSTDHIRQYSIPPTSSGEDPSEQSIEARVASFSIALTNTPHISDAPENRTFDLAWKSAGIESVLAIPVIGSTDMVVVLGTTRFAAYTPESAAIANRFVPALTAAFAGGSSEPIEALSSTQPRSITKTREYIESIASATELVSACGVIATQITNLTGASRVQIGFIEEETGQAHLGFDIEASDDYLEIARISPSEFELLTKVDSEHPAGTPQRYSIVRTAIKVGDRVIGYVEAKQDASGFDKSDVVKIHEITSACAPVVATLKQLEQSESTLKKLELLRRVIDQIRSEKSKNPIHSPRIASLIRNLFDADWIYFGSVDHENDYSTTAITDGVDVPELATDVRVSRRSLLIPSTLAASGPIAIDLESAAPGQRASGRWMYRAGLRSAICAPLHLNGVVTTMFMCASRKPNGFGSLEKKLATAIVSELEISIERVRNSASPNGSDHEKGSAQLVIEQLGPNLHSILNSASALVLTIDKTGIVTEVAGRGIKGLNLVPERLLGRDFIAYSRKIAGLEEALKRALSGQSDRIEIEIFGTVLDAWMEPAVSPNGESGSATVVVSDITDRVAAARSEAALKLVKEEQDRASKFIVSLSHEMKAPLTTVVALADLLSMNDRGNLHPDQIERIQVVQQNADRLTLLVNDFLNISKMEAGTFKANPSKFQISELAHDLRTSFEPIANGQDHSLDVTAPDEHQFATADRELLRQAIINLLSNASKYSPPNTNIALDIWVDEQDLRITVTDEGPGIAREDRDMVFEAYKQLDNPNVPGTGMGLTIVRQIVELHGGKVWVEDGGGGGTSFAVWLPNAVTNN